MVETEQETTSSIFSSFEFAHSLVAHNEWMCCYIMASPIFWIVVSIICRLQFMEGSLFKNGPDSKPNSINLINVSIPFWDSSSVNEKYAGSRVEYLVSKTLPSLGNNHWTSWAEGSL